VKDMSRHCYIDVDVTEEVFFSKTGKSAKKRSQSEKYPRISGIRHFSPTIPSY